jgi:hypothetical protein
VAGVTPLASASVASAPVAGVGLAEGQSVRKAVGRLLGQGPVEEGVDAGRQAGGAPGRGHGRLVNDGVGERGEIFALEGAPAAEGLVENHGQGEEVAAPVRGVAANLLG